MRWGAASASVDKSFVHVEDQGYWFAFGLLSDVFGNLKGIFVCNPAIEVVLELSGERGTVVRKRNWRMRFCCNCLFSGWGSSFFPALTTAYFMNIGLVKY